MKNNMIFRMIFRMNSNKRNSEETTMNGKERLQAVLAGKQSDVLPNIPITMMLAADLYGRTYREYAADYHVLAQAQAQVSEQFGFDHVSVISDPAVEAADCGAAVLFPENQPPALDEAHSLLQNTETLIHLQPPPRGGGRRMANRLAGVAELCRLAGHDRIVEGWIEGPVAESADLRGINRLLMDFYDNPEFVRDLFAFVLDMEMEFAREQVQAGADWIGIGDAACSLLGPDLYEEYVHPYHLKFIKGIHALGVPVRLHICGNISALLPRMGDLEPDIFDIDSMVSLSSVRAAVGPDCIITGNVNPVEGVMQGTPESITAELAECFAAVGSTRYAVNAGCEIPRGTPAENLLALRNFARGC
jgi:MtaA/CmuA family methyltransferase